MINQFQEKSRRAKAKAKEQAEKEKLLHWVHNPSRAVDSVQRPKVET